jgi:peptidase E
MLNFLCYVPLSNLTINYMDSLDASPSSFFVGLKLCKVGFPVIVHGNAMDSKPPLLMVIPP